MNRVESHVIWILFALLAAPGSAAAQSVPPGDLVDVGGHRLHIHCLGTGSPTVVVDGGAGAWSIFYRSLQERIAGTTRACVYDRAGLGWSEEGPAPRSSERMAAELEALLNASEERPPYVLVGHSLGGWNARLLAHRRPDLVAGVVLVESAHEEQWERLPPEARSALEAGIRRYRSAAAAARSGSLPAGSVPPGPFAEDQPSLRAAYRAQMTSALTYETMAAEVEGSTESAAAVAEIGDLGEIPLAVVTARNSFAAFEGTGIPVDAADAAWFEMQRELVSLSDDSRWFVSETGDHRIQRTDPDLVVEAVLDVVDRARGKARGSNQR